MLSLTAYECGRRAAAVVEAVVERPIQCRQISSPGAAPTKLQRQHSTIGTGDFNRGLSEVKSCDGDVEESQCSSPNDLSETASE